MTLPDVLVNPPWRRTPRDEKVAKKKDASVEPAEAATLSWEPGERERFAGNTVLRVANPAAEEKLFERLLDELDKKTPLKTDDVARLGDEKLAELAEEMGPSNVHSQTMKLLLARLGDSIAPHAVTIVRAAPRERLLFEAAMPIRSRDLARNAAAIFFERELGNEPYVLSEAEAWLLRHADVAAAGLVDVEGDAARRVAFGALAFMASHGKLDAMANALDDETRAWLAPFAALAPLASRAETKRAVILAARGQEARAVTLLEHEPDAAAYVARVREREQKNKMDAVPEGVAALPNFFDVEKLPHVFVKETREELPRDAMRALGEMLRFSPLNHPYVGVAQVRAACDGESLDAFALALMQAWRAAGEDPREVWALESCGKIGRQTCAREIATCIRSWARGADAPRYGWDEDSHRMVLVASGSRGYAYARAGCGVLAAIDDDVARLALEDLAKTGVQIWLRKVAHELLGDGDERHDEVDAPVPTVGLDEDGSATLDLGARSYRVHFTEGLGVYLMEAQSDARIETFPKQRKEDDAKKYSIAKDRYTTITKDSKIVARFQTALLQTMMVSQRTFTPAQFVERFVKHPLLRHLGRRVIWSASPKSGVATFRIAEDGTFADEHDGAFAIDHRAITIAHPVLMNRESLDAWRARFHDYELLQPFPQIDREVFKVTAEEIGEREISGIAGNKTSRGKLFQLGRAWRPRHESEDNMGTSYTCVLESGAEARIRVEPPVMNGSGAATMRRAHGTEVFTITLATCSYSLDRLTPIEYSEVRRDLVRASVLT